MINEFADDRPVEKITQDQLGFDGPAKKVTDAILKSASPEGFVIGLEGVWGSGKSSLINLIADYLKTAKLAPEIVHFSPWLISSRDALLSQLFGEIAGAADTILDTKTTPQKPWWKGGPKQLNTADKSRLGDKIEKYGSQLVWAGNAAKVAGLVGIPWASEAGEALKKVGSDGSALVRKTSLNDQRENIKAELRKLDRRIVVFIDDLDRLEPKDVGEVVRLVRAVGDFPNVVYVLSYARNILTKNLAKAFSLSEEDRYIDKIVQVTFRVPQPESFALRRLFRAGVDELFPEYISKATTGTDISAGERINSAIDGQGGTSLRTPRDVNRALNALRLYAGASLDNIDLGDMIWLQLIRLRNEELYSWVENYMTLIGSLVNENGQMDSESKLQIATELVELIQKEKKMDDVDRALYRFGLTIPGLEKTGDMNRRNWNCLQGINVGNLSNFIDGKRLGSPSHYRYYFALTEPLNALNEDALREFFALLEADVKAAIEFVIGLCREQSQAGVPKADLFFQRLESASVSALTPKSQVNLIMVLANTLDEAARVGVRGEWGRIGVIETGRRIFYTLIENEESISTETLETTFGDGEAIGWLSQIVRRETFAQGRYGEQAEPEQLWRFTRDEVDTIISSYVENIQGRPIQDILNSSDFANIMYAWAQAIPDGYTVVKKWCALPMQDDETFLDVLIGLRGWTNSSNRGVYYPLKRQSVEAFFDYDETYQRVYALQNSNDDAVSRKSEIVITAFNDAKDD